jgi:hypothetical protein
MRSFGGDADELSEVNVIGPFSSEATRDSELLRLKELRMDAGLEGLYDLEPTTLEAIDALNHASPEESYEVDTFEELLAALWGC